MEKGVTRCTRCSLAGPQKTPEILRPSGDPITVPTLPTTPARRWGQAFVVGTVVRPVPASPLTAYADSCGQSFAISGSGFITRTEI